MKSRADSLGYRIFVAGYIAALSLALGACVTSPSRVTQAALEGDAAAIDDFLKSSSEEINIPALFETSSPRCPGHNILTPLQAAACSGQETVIRKLLSNKADINLATASGQTPLMLAIVNKHGDVARLLVAAEARLENADAAGNTALLLAAVHGDRPLAEVLLKNGASPKAQNKAGETALLLAKDISLARMLAALGADPLAVSTNGDSGLHLAARSGNAQMAKFFLEQGVDVGLRNRDGASALDIARTKGAPATGNAGTAVDQARLASIAKRRGLPPAGRSDAPLDPDLAQKRMGVASLIEFRMAQALSGDVAAADQAAQNGRSTDALALYTAAIVKAMDIGGTPERELRQKIVRYAASLPQAPALPEKAREHLVRSSFLLKKGRDMSLIENEVAAALQHAPWWAEGYYNLGQIQAERGKYDAAEQNLRLFIDAMPADPRAQSAQDRIYEIKLTQEEEGKIRGMEGRWKDGGGQGYSVSIKGDKIYIRSDKGLTFSLTQENEVIKGSVEGGSRRGEHNCTIPAQMHPVTGRLAPDAKSISLEYLWSHYKTRYHCVNMAGVPSNCCLLCDKVCDAVTVSGSDRLNLQLRPAR